MNSKLVVRIFLQLVIVSLLSIIPYVQIVEGSGTIYIRADGGIDPSTVNMVSNDNVTYTFTGEIFDSIVVERDNIIIDGVDNKMTGQTYEGKAISLSGRTNVTIKNIYASIFYYFIWINNSSNIKIEDNRMDIIICYAITLIGSANNTISGNELGPVNSPPLHACLDGGINMDSSNNNSILKNTIRRFDEGVKLSDSDNNLISRNSIIFNGEGITLEDTSKNRISGNNITNNEAGIILRSAVNNSIISNTIASNGEGITLEDTSKNRISGNNITNNTSGVELFFAYNNTFYHNNFVNNLRQVYDFSWDLEFISPSINRWDNGDPSAGNYWSDYTEHYPQAIEVDGSGVWNTSYVIDENNHDTAPLVEVIPEFPTFLTLSLLLVTTLLISIFSRKKYAS